MPDNELIYCLIRPEGGAIKVTLRVSNALMSGSSFAVWKADGETERESWKLSAGTAGSGDRSILAAPNTLEGNYLTWEVRVCSPMAAIETGAVEILVSQDGVSCPITKTLRWDLDEVPQCESGNVTAITRSLIFRNR